MKRSLISVIIPVSTFLACSASTLTKLIIPLRDPNSTTPLSVAEMRRITGGGYYEKCTGSLPCPLGCQGYRKYLASGSYMTCALTSNRSDYCVQNHTWFCSYDLYNKTGCHDTDFSKSSADSNGRCVP